MSEETSSGMWIRSHFLFFGGSWNGMNFRMWIGHAPCHLITYFFELRGKIMTLGMWNWHVPQVIPLDIFLIFAELHANF